MKPFTVCLACMGLLLVSLTCVFRTAAAEVTLPVHDRPVAFFDEAHPGLSVGRLPEGIAGLSAQACGGCHPQEYAEWKESAHARASTEPVFAAAFAAEPRAVCRGCHSPLPEQHPRRIRRLQGGERPPLGPQSRVRHTEDGRPYVVEPNPTYQRALLAEGVTCISCHVRDGTVLSSKPRAAANVPHPLKYSPLMAKAEFCGGCHQFDIRNPRAHPFEREPLRVAFQPPKRAIPPSPEDHPPVPRQPGLDSSYHLEPRVQHTLDEFRLSPAAASGGACQGCHMPRQRVAKRFGTRETRARHNWPGRSSPEMLRRAVSLAARLDRPLYREGETLQAVIKLRNNAAHRFPTGDGIHAGILDACLYEGKKLLGRQVYVLSSQGSAGFFARSVFFSGASRFVTSSLSPHEVRDSGGQLEVPARADTRLLPDEEVTVVYRQPVGDSLAKARAPVLRVRIYHSAVHPGFRGTSIDPKTDTVRLVQEVCVPVALVPRPRG